MGNKDEISDPQVGRVGESRAARIARILHGDVPRIETIGILTAANPLGNTTPKYDNKRLNRGLYQDLLTYGIRQIKGRYGRMENPYLVADISRDRVIGLGRKYSQESVIFGWCDRVTGCVQFELICTSPDQSSRGSVGTVVFTRRIVLRHPLGTGGPDQLGADIVTQEHDARITEPGDDDEHADHRFCIPFFDDNFLEPEFRGSRVLNYYRHEIPRTAEAQQALERFLARDRALQHLLSEPGASGHALHERRGDQNLRLIELHELMGDWSSFPLFTSEDAW